MRIFDLHDCQAGNVTAVIKDNLSYCQTDTTIIKIPEKFAVEIQF